MLWHMQLVLILFLTIFLCVHKQVFAQLGSAEPSDIFKAEVRPFITDDARVVGGRLAQLESWIRIDRESGQHWFLTAYGPTEKWELTVGGVLGYEVEQQDKRSFSYALPLLQAKFLAREYKPNELPGVAIVAGTFLPGGRGGFQPPGYGAFAFGIITQSLGERDKILIHGNLGINHLWLAADYSVMTWGLGSQFRVKGGFHGVVELFSGDPYIPGTGTAYQVGFRHFFSDLFQIDMTYGKGIGGEVVLPHWFSAGIRLVTEKFLKNRPVR